MSLSDRKIKDPSAVLDYLFVWGPSTRTKSPWLEADETITAHSIEIFPAGLGLETSEVTNNGKDVVVWLSGGTATVPYTVTCQITTNKSRTDVRTMHLDVQNR